VIHYELSRLSKICTAIIVSNTKAIRGTLHQSGMVFSENEKIHRFLCGFFLSQTVRISYFILV